MSSLISLNNGFVYFSGDGFLKKNILIRDGIIANISSSPFNLGERIDCNNYWVLPGAIDPHVHFRVPGGERKEDWGCGSRAAVSSGVTSVIDMPNTSPTTTTLEALEDKRRVAYRDSLVNFGFHFGLSLDNLDELDNISNIASIKVYFGSSTGNLLVSDERYLKRVMEKIGHRSIPLAFHAEDEDILQENIEKYGSYENKFNVLRFHNMLRSPSCALSAVRKIINIASSCSGIKLYFCHISTAGEIDLLQEARKFMDIHIESAPHHIFLSYDNFPSDLSYLGKVNPPLRGEEDRKELYLSFLRGKIDLIGTDHAPHLIEEKKSSYKDAPSGMPGLESFAPLLLNELSRGNISVESFVNFTSGNASRIFSIKNKGFISKGSDADIILVDPSMDYTLDKSLVFTKAGWNPFEGRKLRARVIKTIVGGKLVFSLGSGFYDNSRGSELQFR